jgi:integrase
MKGQPAKVLGPADVRRLLGAASKGRYPARNRVIVLLSVKAGLRACEIAHLTWPMVLNAKGGIGDILELPAKAAKMGSGRRIPIHPDLKSALQRVARTCSDMRGPVARSERDQPLTPKSVVNWFKIKWPHDPFTRRVDHCVTCRNWRVIGRSRRHRAISKAAVMPNGG